MAHPQFTAAPRPDGDLIRYCLECCVEDGDTTEEAIQIIADYFGVTREAVREAIRE